MNDPQFIHLRVHSAYSLLQGAIQVKALPELAGANAQPAVALTDSGNLFAALEFSEAAAKAGIQPILGCQLDLAYAPALRPGDRAAGAPPDRPARAVGGRLREPHEAQQRQLPRQRRGRAARHARRRSRLTPKG